MQFIALWVFILIGFGIGWFVGASRPDYTGEVWFIPFETRWKLLLLAWVIAALATVYIEIPLLLFFPMFPWGLLYLICGDDHGGRPDVGSGHASGNELTQMVGLMAIGWLIYITITDAALITRRRLTYFLLYSVLCVLLIFNVVGCHRLLRHVE
jgi:hypothetical protein